MNIELDRPRWPVFEDFIPQSSPFKVFGRYSMNIELDRPHWPAYKDFIP